jgi:hypothetical protein
MARVALFCPDLLFGSKVEGALTAAGHEVTRLDSEEDARALAGQSELLIVDLTVDGERRASLGELADPPTLGFYAHVDQEVRRRAEDAGFDRVVPRSRMHREGPALVDELLA